MSQQLVTQDQGSNALFQKANQLVGANAGSVAIEQERAIAEAQGQLILAKKFPRDLTSAHAELMTACKSVAFAGQAFYTVPNRGSGPSIRFAEEVARVYGNFQYGHRELSRHNGKSEVEVFAWDMQNNNRSIRQITVDHVQYTRSSGNKAIVDPSDIDNKIANVASKQMRGRILALMPKWLVAEAIDECKKTLLGNNSEPLETRVRRMTQAFSNQFGIKTTHLEKYLKHSLDTIMLEELVELQGVFNALREGVPASEYFGADGDESDSVAASITESAKSTAPALETKKQPALKKETEPAKAVEAKAAEPTKAAKEEKQPEKAKPEKPEKQEQAKKEQAVEAKKEVEPEAPQEEPLPEDDDVF